MNSKLSLVEIQPIGLGLLVGVTFQRFNEYLCINFSLLVVMVSINIKVKD